MKEHQVRNYCVYMHTFPNGKRYIGLTGEINPQDRWKNGRNYRNNPYMTRAVEKYGWNNIKHEIVFAGLTKQEAEEKEKMLIAFFNSNNPGNGYNITSGGECVGKHSIESRRKMSEAKKRQSADPEYRKRLSEAHKGHVPWSKGIKMSDEFKTKVSEAKKGIRYPSKWVPVLCVETGITYQSQRDAEMQTGVSCSKISAVCHGHRKTAGGFHWRLKENDGKT